MFQFDSLYEYVKFLHFLLVVAQIQILGLLWWISTKKDKKETNV